MHAYIVYVFSQGVTYVHNPVPFNRMQLLEIIKISSPFVKKLEIKQLLPQLSGQSLADEEEGDT